MDLIKLINWKVNLSEKCHTEHNKTQLISPHPTRKSIGRKDLLKAHVT